MAITSQDVKLYASQFLTDQPDGGGRMSNVEIVDGQVNNLFPDLSDLDRVYGRASFRKAYLQITTDNRDLFLGANAIVTRPPEDGQVSVVAFTTNSYSDTRADAQQRVEQYLIAGPRSTLTLYDTQLEGQLQIIAYQRVEDALPEVGETLVLSVEDSGEALNGVQQYVRIQNVDSVVQTFLEGFATSAVEYQKAVVTLTISSALMHSFPGGDVVRNPVNDTSATKLRRTNVASGATYYGVTRLAADITPGDVEIQVQNILQPIIPSATEETAILDLQLGADSAAAVAAGDEYTQALPLPTITTNNAVVQAPRGIVPTAAVLSVGSGTNAITLTDVGGGVMTRTAGGSGTVGASGEVDYRTGQITITGLSAASFSGPCALTYEPAAFPQNVNHTQGEEITVSNRGRVRVASLNPLPAPGALVVTYRSLGVWYTLTDDGGGQIVGTPGTGVGSVNYSTGSVAVTLGYEPDVGSHVLYGWGSGVHYGPVPDVDEVDLGYVLFDLALAEDDLAIDPGSVSITWSVGETDYTATASSAGDISGHGTGEVDHAAGTIKLRPNDLVAPDTEFTVDYEFVSRVSEAPSVSIVGGNREFTLASVARPGTLVVNAVYQVEILNISIPVRLVESGAVFRTSFGNKLADAVLGLKYNVSYGAYAQLSGLVTLPSTLGDGYQRNVWQDVGGTLKWVAQDLDVTFLSVTSVHYVADTETPDTDSITASAPVLELDLATRGYSMVPGSLLFEFNGRSIYDVGGQLRYRDVATGIEHPQGMVDYGSGEATLTDWALGTRDITLRGVLTKFGDWPMSEVIWRTSGAPIRNSSFIASYQEPGQEIDQATSDEDGIIAGPNVTGTIIYSTGVYQLAWTDPVVPQTARYNAVAVTFLPLDPALIGINPVRLPLDGRVPIIRPANVLVIHDTAYTTLTNPVSAGEPYSLGRTALSYAIVRDTAGELVPTDKYTTDLDAGTVEFTAPLDLSEYTQPLIVEHRIEDRVLCTDAQLSGDLTVFGFIGHAYDAATAYVSSALLFDRNDLEARAFGLFEQQTWTGVWSDALIGSPSTGQYDLVNYPIVTTNEGATRERWRLTFTTSNAVNVIGESVGQILSAAPISGEIAPINPATGAPYFSIDPTGWGGGWVAGNTVRFNTDPCGGSMWFIRCTLPGEIEAPTDDFRVQLRGNAN